MVTMIGFESAIACDAGNDMVVELYIPGNSQNVDWRTS
jgi:hypothetical protein